MHFLISVQSFSPRSKNIWAPFSLWVFLGGGERDNSNKKEPSKVETVGMFQIQTRKSETESLSSAESSVPTISMGGWDLHYVQLKRATFSSKAIMGLIQNKNDDCIIYVF